MIKALFVCSRNKLRSPTAEAIFAARGDVEALSAGTGSDAENPISADLVEWADIIFVMERIHRDRINEKFSSLVRGKRIIVLDIPDNYGYMDPELVAILERRVPQHLRAGSS
ncbi:MAG TPA: low molecular weight protein tyrosine phosphatase family protein [Acidobacteriaceae bacterium]